MPAFRSPKKTWGQSAAPYKRNGFIASQESLDEGVDEEYRSRAERDPYTHYVLKTGKQKGKTLKQIHEEGDASYVRWMLTNPKACKDSDDGHNVKKGLLHWQSAVEGTVTASLSAGRVTSISKTSTSAANPQTARFRDSHGRNIWITGYDIFGLFHMTEAQLKRSGVHATSSYSNGMKQYRTNVYTLQKVYEAAVSTPNCPIDETPDEALERYLAKVEKCGGGRMMALPKHCKCNECETIWCGPTRGGRSFWQHM
jgi:hypothetical protein